MSGFSFVLIPASLDEPMEELFFPDEITNHTDIQFVRHLRSLLGHKATELEPTALKDKNRKLQELCAGAGDQATSHLSRHIECEHIDLVLTLMAVDNLVLSVPKLATNAKGVSLYHDGKSKTILPRNDRAMALVEACGFTGKDLRGTCFLVRVEEFMERDNENPSWRRCNLGLADCSSAARWVQEIRSAREASGIKAEEERRWFESLPDDDPALPSGQHEDYSWSQTEDEIEISFKPDPLRGIKAVRRDVVVRITERSLFVRLRGRVLLDVSLYAEVDAANSCWVYTQDSYDLQVTLAKVEGCEPWPSLYQAEKVQAPVKEAVCMPSAEVISEPTETPTSSDGKDDVPDTSTSSSSGSPTVQKPQSTPVLKSTCGLGHLGEKLEAHEGKQSRRAKSRRAHEPTVEKRPRRSLIAWAFAAVGLYYLVALSAWTISRTGNHRTTELRGSSSRLHIEE